MDTKVIQITENDINAALSEAAQIIRSGGVVGFPTETVYGLGADALNVQAVSAIFTAKGRPGDNPLIVHISEFDQLDALIRDMLPAAKALAQAYWPGAMTLVLPKSEIVPEITTAGLDTVAIRMPSNDIARKLIWACSCPIAAPSANLSGRPSPTSAAHVLEDMNGRIPLILDGGDCSFGLESTVIGFVDGIPLVLRPGAITPEDIKRVAGDVRLHPSLLRPLGDEPAVSPGMKHKHYAPRAHITILCGEEKSVARRVVFLYNEKSAEHKKTMILARTERAEYAGLNVLQLPDEEAAHALYAVLRDADERGIEEIIAEGYTAEGVGLAVMNRLARAAGFNIEQV